jgi:hypothetical protein
MPAWASSASAQRVTIPVAVSGTHPLSAKSRTSAWPRGGPARRAGSEGPHPGSREWECDWRALRRVPRSCWGHTRTAGRAPPVATSYTRTNPLRTFRMGTSGESARVGLPGKDKGNYRTTCGALQSPLRPSADQWLKSPRSWGRWGCPGLRSGARTVVPSTRVTRDQCRGCSRHGSARRPRPERVYRPAVLRRACLPSEAARVA